jgi:hypothetical protein
MGGSLIKVGVFAAAVPAGVEEGSVQNLGVDAVLTIVALW